MTLFDKSQFPHLFPDKVDHRSTAEVIFGLQERRIGVAVWVDDEGGAVRWAVGIDAPDGIWYEGRHASSPRLALQTALRHAGIAA